MEHIVDIPAYLILAPVLASPQHLTALVLVSPGHLIFSDLAALLIRSVSLLTLTR